MAITEETLGQLDGRSYGPVTFSSAKGAHSAAFAGRQAEIGLNDEAVQVSFTLDVPWPQRGEPADIDRRIASTLTLASAIRPELITMTADRQTTSVNVSLWIDAQASDIHGLATAVRTCILLGDVAWRAVEEVATAITGQEELLREAAEAQARLEEAEQALERMASLPEAAGPAPAVSSPPTTEAQPQVAAESPSGAAQDVRFCPACGRSNESKSRFCIACGQSLQ
jgi:hypothetical protein